MKVISRLTISLEKQDLIKIKRVAKKHDWSLAQALRFIIRGRKVG